MKEQLDSRAMEILLFIVDAKEKITMAWDKSLNREFSQSYELISSANQDIKMCWELHTYLTSQATTDTIEADFIATLDKILQGIQEEYLNIKKLTRLLQQTYSL